MITQTIDLLFGFSAGLVLGLLYFGGLWFTVRSLPRARRPVLVSLGSFFARTALVVAGFFFLSGGKWERILAVLAGFILMRVILVRVLGKKGNLGRFAGKEVYRHGD